MIHIALHFLVPVLIARIFFPRRWVNAYLIMVATILVDVDHVLASPMYNPDRCSIGFHPLHQPWLIALYLILCFVPKARLIGLGLIIHMGLDAIDCQVTSGVWLN